MSNTFQAGAAEIDITPQQYLPMDGYMAREGLSDGTHDPLMAAVLILSDGAKYAAIITLDVLAVSTDFTRPLREAVAKLIDSSSDAVLVCPSHTHCGPAGLQNWFPPGEAPDLNHELVAYIHERVLQATRTALARLAPVRLVYNTGTIEGIGGNRNNPDVPVDSQVMALRFERKDGSSVAILFHYACHPTILGSDTREYSADFPGAARKYLQARYPGAVCMYLNGATGDISTRFTRQEQSYAEVDRMGKMLADKVITLLDKPQPEPDLSVSWDKLQVNLPFRTIPDTPAPPPATTGLDRSEQTRAEGAAIQTTLRRAVGSSTVQPAEILLLKIGRWIFCAIPGEPFSALATSVRAASPFALILGLTNDYVGYLPTQTAIDSGTYEALSSPYDARALNIIETALIQRLSSSHSGAL